MLACALALILLVDVSGSVTEENYNLQRTGIADSFKDHSVQRAIEAQPGGVAITLMEWSSDTFVVIPWTVLKTNHDINKFSERVTAAKKTNSNLTALGFALSQALDYMNEAPCVPERRVIDISGDGPSNEKEEPDRSKDRAIQEGVVINGLPIITIVYPEVVEYYRDRVITPDGFLVEATDFEDFFKSMRRKLITEIAKK